MGISQRLSLFTRTILPSKLHTMANTCLRSILLITNSLLALIGVLMLAGGIWLVSDENSAQDVAKKIVNSTDMNESLPSDVIEGLEEIYGHKYFNYLIIGLGVISLLVALFGFCGAKKESVCLISFYIIFTILLIILQIGAIVMINVRNENIETFKTEVSEFLTVDLEKLEGSGFYQTIFFGVLAGISCMVLLVSSCFCHSVRNERQREEQILYGRV